MQEDSSSHSTNYMGNTDHDVSFEDLVQNEHLQKERTLFRISQAKRERSGSNLSLDKIPERSSRVDKLSKEVIDDLGEDYDEDDDEDDKDGSRNDLRKALFESIPEPYPHTTNYSRVCISDPGDPVDFDTKDACAKLKMCMDVRNKWIGAHPYPPQDLENAFPSEPSSPERPVTRKGKPELNFRRRDPPTYEVFGTPLPHSLHNLHFKMVKGVVMVQNTNAAEDLLQASPVGLVLTSDEMESTVQALDRSLNLSQDEQDKVKYPGLAEDSDGLDWSKSVYPVYDYKEYVKDYYSVSYWSPLCVLRCNAMFSLSMKALVKQTT